MYGIIYKATGPTGLVYIGKTKNSLTTRKANHAYRTRKGDRRTAFHVALLALGFKSFSWEQIDTAENVQELDAKEKHWIAHYQSDNPAHGYNGTEGGENTVYSEETKRKISAALKGKKSPTKGKKRPGHSAKMREAWEHKKNKNPLAGKHTPETKQKISETLKRKGIKPPITKGKTPWNKGRVGVYSQETLQRISAALKGKKRPPRTEEYRKKISMTHKGRIISEEQKRKTSATLKGRTLTEEHRRKISETAKRKKAARVALGV